MTQPLTSNNKHLFYSFSLLLLVDVLSLVFEKLASINTSGTGLAFYLNLLKQPYMWLGIGMGPIQLFIWKYILARTELSLAYPLTSLCYPLTMLFSVVFLKEKLDLTVWIGGLLITIGVAVLNMQTKGKNHAAT